MEIQMNKRALISGQPRTLLMNKTRPNRSQSSRRRRETKRSYNKSFQKISTSALPMLSRTNPLEITHIIEQGEDLSWQGPANGVATI